MKPTLGAAEAGPDWGQEAQRQRSLLALLWADAEAHGPGLAGTAAARERGLAAYRANAAALAQRALAAAYPTVALLLGDESFAALARAHWHRQAPQCGDIARWGDSLPEALQGDLQLHGEPYLADVARLDWAVHCASVAADDQGPARGLDLLATTDPAHLRVRLRAGSAVLASPHPIVDIWRAHHVVDGDLENAGAGPENPSLRFAEARQALHEGRGQAAWVTRAGSTAVQVLALDQYGAEFTAALLQGRSLEQALWHAGDGFNFEAWLIQALRHAALAAVQASA